MGHYAALDVAVRSGIVLVFSTSVAFPFVEELSGRRDYGQQ